MSQYNLSSGEVAGAVLFLDGNTGGDVGPTVSGVINVVGTGGTTVTGNPSTNTLTISVSGSGLTWNVISASSANMATNNGYITTNAGTTTLTLPSTSNVGDYITVIGDGTGQWVIACGSGQTIRVGSAITSSGGSVTSANSYDSIDIVCRTANTTWVADGAPQSAGLTLV